MISFFNNVFVFFGGFYILNRLLYRFYFPKKPKFLPLQQLLIEHIPSKHRFFTKKSAIETYKITVNLDDHNRLINPLLIQTQSKIILGSKIFRAYLNVMLPRYEKSIYMLNSNEFLQFCNKKANLYSLGKSIAFAETLELIPDLIKRFQRKGPLFFQIGYSLNSLNKRKILTIMPFNIMTELKPKFYQAKIHLLREDEINMTPTHIEEATVDDSQYLPIYMDKNDIILGRPDTSFLIFYLNEKNELTLAFLASNRAFYNSCYQKSFYKMLEVMLKNNILIEKTKFIDVQTLTHLIQNKKLIEMLVLFEDGLISSINELISYGKSYNLTYSKEPKSLFMKIFILQKDMMIKKVNARVFNQDLKRFWF